MDQSKTVMKVAAEAGAAVNGGVAVVEVGTAAEAVELSSAVMIGAAVAEIGGGDGCCECCGDGPYDGGDCCCCCSGG